MKRVKITSYDILSRDIAVIEIDIRDGIPGVDIMGLSGYAHTGTTNRLREAIVNSGFEFPTQRILINLHPIKIHKWGTLYDLPMALGILAASGQIPWDDHAIMAIGGLGITGKVYLEGFVSSAVSIGIRKGIDTFIIPLVNAIDLDDDVRDKVRDKQKSLYGVKSLTEAVNSLKGKGKTTINALEGRNA